MFELNTITALELQFLKLTVKTHGHTKDIDSQLLRGLDKLNLQLRFLGSDIAMKTRLFHPLHLVSFYIGSKVSND